MSTQTRSSVKSSTRPSKAVRPISPAEAVARKIESLPPAVITCWNELIAKNLRDGEAVIQQRDIFTAIKKAMGLSGSQAQRIFTEGWLDVEPLFRANGWTVVYDKPSYDESYDANWRFRQKRQPRRKA